MRSVVSLLLPFSVVVGCFAPDVYPPTYAEWYAQHRRECCICRESIDGDRDETPLCQEADRVMRDIYGGPTQ